MGNAFIKQFLIIILIISSSAGMYARDTLIMQLRDPHVRAFLDTIAFAEGTNTKNGYRTIFGHYLFKSYRCHPGVVVCCNSNGKQLCSSAAGKYQFSQKMWAKVSKLIGAKNFSPQNQERAAIYLLIDSGAMKHVKKGLIIVALQKVRKIWASMPGAPYRQPMKKEAVLRAYFKKRLAHHNKRGFRGGML